MPNLQGTDYRFESAYRRNHALRASYNALTRRIYGFDFEQWYQSGWWGESYRPYSLLDGDRVVSNVSVSLQEFRILGERRLYAQLGAVMTAPEYRGRGLSRWLLQRVLEEYSSSCDQVFLFANDSVLEFYPKFGFIEAQETAHTIVMDGGRGAARPLNPADPKDQALLLELYRSAARGSPLALEKNEGLLMFYALGFWRENFYYLEDLHAAAIAQWEGDTLHCMDVFGPGEVSLKTLLTALARPDTRRVELGFTPPNPQDFQASPCREEDTTLFLLQGLENPFEAHSLRFPVLSHT